MNTTITLANAFGSIILTLASFDDLRALVLKGEKINAIKLVRTLQPYWGLKECKDYVEALNFASVGISLASTPVPGKEDTTFLSDVKDDLRAILVTDEHYRNGLTLDLFARVCAKVGLAR